MSLAVANRYARALADAVMADGSGLEPQAAIAGLADFAAAVKESPELRTILTSPAVSVARKRAVVSRLCDAMGAHKLIRNFLFVAVDHGRIASLPEIAAAFQAAVDERQGRVRAEVASASPLDEAREASLRAELARMTGKQVRCEFQVNPELIGGVSVRIGSTIYDGSVRGQLDALGARLSARS
jgi:F-type H+-transporting ATPase subunit delta